MWHIQGRDFDLLFDTGLGHFPLRSSIAALRERPVICVASHSHFDHIGCHHEFDQRCIHAAEADILADPRNDRTMADRYATDEMFDGIPEGWAAGQYRIKSAPATRTLSDGEAIDFGQPCLRGGAHARPFARRHRFVGTQDRHPAVGRHHL
jgi:glyoxylase-like metal-dependent hydrolase (beta-lactamase superfamily II)